jgi:hypothetical protein
MTLSFTPFVCRQPHSDIDEEVSEGVSRVGYTMGNAAGLTPFDSN